jgi:hypothetical protein
MFRDTAEGELLKKGVTDVIIAIDARKEGKAVHRAACALSELVSSEIDSDRAEYLVRDGQVSGAASGRYDLDRLIDSYSLVRQAGREDQDCYFRPSARALATIESVLVARVQTYAYLYYHNVGMLLDALLVRVLRTMFGPDREVVMGEVTARGADSADLAAATNREQRARLHYSAYADPQGYSDDATLWAMLRDVLRALERLGAAAAGPKTRRLHVSLKILLRRRRHWVSIWKRPTQFKDIDRSLEATVLRYFKTNATLLRRNVAADYENITGYAIEAKDVKILNWLVARFRGQGAVMDALAEELTERLNADERTHGKKYWIEIAERTRFDPLKDPLSYEIADDKGESLVTLASLAPGTVRAVRSMWYEYIHVRMYVVAADELEDAEERRRLASVAADLLPAALTAWMPKVSLAL